MLQTLKGLGNENLPSLPLSLLTYPNPSSQARPIVNRNINWGISPIPRQTSTRSKSLAKPQTSLDSFPLDLSSLHRASFQHSRLYSSGRVLHFLLPSFVGHSAPSSFFLLPPSHQQSWISRRRPLSTMSPTTAMAAKNGIHKNSRVQSTAEGSCPAISRVVTCR